MTLFIDNFSITGNVDELVDFIRKYNSRTFYTTGIGDVCKPLDDIANTYNNLTFMAPGEVTVSGVMNDTIGYYKGRSINSMSDIDLIQALVDVEPALAKEYDLETLSREELIKLLIQYVPTNIGHL